MSTLTRPCLLAVTAILIAACELTYAGKPGSAEYTIIDLTGPYHDQSTSNGWSRTFAYRISDPDSDGSVYVLGDDYSVRSGVPCVWTIKGGNVSVEDLNGMIEIPTDINAAGIISGVKSDSPALLLHDNQIVYVEDETSYGRVTAINNPDEFGNFQAVGHTYSLETFAKTPKLWNVNVDGTVLSSTTLIETNGFRFFATDISDAKTLAGLVVTDGESDGVPAIAVFTAQGLEASLRPNPNPDEITRIEFVQVDDGGNVLGDGRQRVDQLRTYSHAVIWPADGGAFDLSSEFGYTTTASGIAMVDNKMQVVGRADRDAKGPFAYLYTGGRLKNLGTLSKGDETWTLNAAGDVNRIGMICADGNVGSPRNYQVHGCVLVPSGL